MYKLKSPLSLLLDGFQVTGRGKTSWNDSLLYNYFLSYFDLSLNFITFSLLFLFILNFITFSLIIHCVSQLYLVSQSQWLRFSLFLHLGPPLRSAPENCEPWIDRRPRRRHRWCCSWCTATCWSNDTNDVTIRGVCHSTIFQLNHSWPLSGKQLLVSPAKMISTSTWLWLIGHC